MKTYYDLIKDNIIRFDSLLLDKYYELNLSEVECIVLLRLYQNLTNNKNSLNTNELAKRLSITSDELGEIIVNLVNRGFMTINLEDNDSLYLETYSIDDTYRKLGYILEGKEVEDINNQVSIEMKKTLKSIESSLNKILSPLEISVVRKWYYDYKYPFEMINEEVEKNLLKHKGINMIDRILYSRNNDSSNNDDALKAKELFSKMYGTK